MLCFGLPALLRSSSAGRSGADRALLLAPHFSHLDAFLNLGRIAIFIGLFMPAEDASSRTDVPVHAFFALLQLGRGAAYFIDDRSSTPDHAIRYAAYALISIPGFAATLLRATRRTGPLRAVQLRLSSSLGLVLACAAWYSHQSSGFAMSSSPPSPTSLASLMANLIALLIASLIASLIARGGVCC